MESFQTRDQTCIPCIGSQILDHWTTWEALLCLCLPPPTPLQRLLIFWPGSPKFHPRPSSLPSPLFSDLQVPTVLRWSLYLFPELNTYKALPAGPPARMSFTHLKLLTSPNELSIIPAWQWGAPCCFSSQSLCPHCSPWSPSTPKSIWKTCVIHCHCHFLKRLGQGFPHGSVVKKKKKATCQCRRHGSIPGPGRSHMPRDSKACAPQLLSLCSGARELQQLKP